MRTEDFFKFSVFIALATACNPGMCLLALPVFAQIYLRMFQSDLLAILQGVCYPEIKIFFRREGEQHGK